MIKQCMREFRFTLGRKAFKTSCVVVGAKYLCKQGKQRQLRANLVQLLPKLESEFAA